MFKKILRVTFYNVLVLSVCVLMVSPCRAEDSIDLSNVSFTGNKDLFVQAINNLSNAKNMHMNVDVSCFFNIQSMAVNCVVKEDLDLCTKPTIGRGTVSVVANGDSTMKYEESNPIYFEEIDGKIITYTTIGKQWVREESIVDETKFLASNNLSGIKSVEQIKDSGGYVYYRITISGKQLDQMGKALHLLSKDSAIVPMDRIFSDIGDIKLEVAVDKEKKVLTGIKSDLSDNVATVIANVFSSVDNDNKKENDKMKILKLFKNVKLVVAVELSKFNDVNDVKVPEDIKASAVDMKLYMDSLAGKGNNDLAQTKVTTENATTNQII